MIETTNQTERKTLMYTYETLIDHYYDEWKISERYLTREQRRAGSSWNYADMILFAYDENPLHALAIPVSNYNGQVCNGGHSQYIFNGYAHGVGGCFDDHPTTEMHDLMLDLFTHLGFAFDTRFTPVLDIMRAVCVDMESLCGNCDGAGFTIGMGVPGGSEWNDGIQECNVCNGSGVVSMSSINETLADKLDDAYYEICDQFMADFKSAINARLQGDTL